MSDPAFNPYAAPESFAPSFQPVADHLDPILQGVAWPLHFQFRIWSFSPQINVVDSAGRTVLHVRQKLFKFREHVEIFTDQTRQTKLAEIRANKIIDWSARYSFTDARGEAIGVMGRRGWKSIWRAHYDVFNPGDEQADFVIREQNPFAKVVDNILGEIPLINLLTLYLFHPRYLASRSDGSPSIQMEKRPSLMQRKFRLDKMGDLSSRETMNLMLSYIMMILLERSRG